MGALRIFGIVLIGVAVFLLIFVYENSTRPGWFLGGMILPSLIIGILLLIAKEKTGYAE
jgi:Na+/proline symporter